MQVEDVLKTDLSSGERRAASAPGQRTAGMGHRIITAEELLSVAQIITRMGWCPRTGEGQRIMIRTAVNEKDSG